MKLALIILCLFFPFIAVWIKDGAFSGKVVLAFVLQLLGHVPGVIYGLLVVLKD